MEFLTDSVHEIRQIGTVRLMEQLYPDAQPALQPALIRSLAREIIREASPQYGEQWKRTVFNCFIRSEWLCTGSSKFPHPRLTQVATIGHMKAYPYESVWCLRTGNHWTRHPLYKHTHIRTLTFGLGWSRSLPLDHWSVHTGTHKHASAPVSLAKWFTWARAHPSVPKRSMV